jgi:hypothetical protein
MNPETELVLMLITLVIVVVAFLAATRPKDHGCVELETEEEALDLAARGRFVVLDTDLNYDELRELSRIYDIPGRSKMNKAELAAAIEKHVNREHQTCNESVTS